MHRIIAVSIALIAAGGLVQSAFAVPMTCEQIFQKCLADAPPMTPAPHCVRLVMKCEDKYKNPDAISGAGPRVPRGEKGEKPGKGGTKLTSPGGVKINAGGALAAAPRSATAAGGAVSGGNSVGVKQEAVPAQLSERLRRLPQR
jgi:hypothetical protein